MKLTQMSFHFLPRASEHATGPDAAFVIICAVGLTARYVDVMRPVLIIAGPALTIIRVTSLVTARGVRSSTVVVGIISELLFLRSNNRVISYAVRVPKFQST